MLKWPYFSSNARKHFIVPLPFLVLGNHPPPEYRPPLGLGFEYSNFATQQNPQLPNQPPPNYSSLQNPGVSNQYPPLGGQPSSSTMIWSSNVVSFTYYITVVWKRHSHWRRNKLQSGGGGGTDGQTLHCYTCFTCNVSIYMWLLSSMSGGASSNVHERAPSTRLYKKSALCNPMLLFPNRTMRSNECKCGTYMYLHSWLQVRYIKLSLTYANTVYKEKYLN